MGGHSGKISASRPGGATSPDGLFSQSIEGCLETRIGTHGLAPALLDKYLLRLEPALVALRDDHASGRLPLLRNPEETADITDA